MAKFENLSDITIYGMHYGEQGTELKGILKYPYNLAFGRNGAGKTTLVRALSNYRHKNDSDACHLDFDKELDDALRQRIFVYDEKFVDQNIRLKQHDAGLGTIAMVGEQVQQGEELDELDENIVKKQGAIDEAAVVYNELKTTLDKESRSLKAAVNAGGYRDRQSRFRGIQETSVRWALKDFEELRTLGEPKFGSDFEGLRSKVRQGLAEVEAAKDANEVTFVMCNQTPKYKEIEALLQRKVESVELTDRDRKIMEIASNHVGDTNEIILTRRYSTCPLCHQDIPEKHRREVEARIKRYFNKEISEYQQQLARSLSSLESIEFSYPEGLPSIYANHKDELGLAVDAENRTRLAWSDAVQMRMKNPTGTVEIPSLGMAEETSNLLTKALAAVSADVDEFNKAIKEQKDRRLKYAEMDRYATYLEHKSRIDMYFEMEKKVRDSEDRLKSTNAEYESLKQKREELNLKLSNANVAITHINRLLSMVFSGPRMRLYANNGMYMLKVRDKDVNPNDVSTGERNALSLAYFFAKIGEGRKIGKRFGSATLVVIDDPVSSFDAGNRSGVLAMMNSEINQLLWVDNKSNRTHNKVLVLSHDLLTIKYLSSSRENYFHSHKSIVLPEDDGLKVFDLNTRSFATNRYDSEYRILLRQVHRFACEEDPQREDYISIGNEMRRVLETFSEVIYGQNINGLIGLKKRYLSLAEAGFEAGSMTQKEWVDARCDFFNSHLTSFILHNASHTAASTDSSLEGEMPFVLREYHDYARIMLLFMLYNQRDHMSAFLGASEAREIEKFDTYFHDSVPLPITEPVWTDTGVA